MFHRLAALVLWKNLVPDYNTLVLESSFHGNEGMMCGREYVGW